MMLPLFVYREMLEGWWQRRANPQPAAAMIYAAENLLYAVERVDSTPLPTRPVTLEFSCELDSGGRQRKVFIGLMDTEVLHAAPHSPGIGVAIDLMTGLVTDVVNDQGVLGYLEGAPFPPHATLPVRVEVEVRGPVYLPRLHIGNDVILHPALYLDATHRLTALVGTSMQPPGDAHFSNGRLTAVADDGAKVVLSPAD